MCETKLLMYFFLLSPEIITVKDLTFTQTRLNNNNDDDDLTMHIWIRNSLFFSKLIRMQCSSETWELTLFFTEGSFSNLEIQTSKTSASNFQMFSCSNFRILRIISIKIRNKFDIFSTKDYCKETLPEFFFLKFAILQRHKRPGFFLGNF